MVDRETHEVIVWLNHQRSVLQASHHQNLRRLLLSAGLSPYAALTQHLNCGGRGLCATCGVWIDEGTPTPIHWHDRVGSRFGYPRLSCQVTVDAPMIVHLLSEKWIWGRRDVARRWRKDTDKG